MKIRLTYILPAITMRSTTSQCKQTAQPVLLAMLLLMILPGIPETSFAKDKRVTVMDRGLHMPRATYLLPKGWKLDHDIATNPNTGKYSRYKFDKLGPQGELTRSLQPVLYGPFQNIDIEQAWRQTAQRALHGILEETRFGQPKNQGPLIDKMKSRPMLRQSMQKMGVNELYEIDISGKRNGKAYIGKVFAAVVPYDSQSGALLMGLFLSPRNLLMKTIDIDIKITESEKPDPKFSKISQQISQRAMRDMQNQHNRRMSDNQQQFNAHQKMMDDRYQGSYQQNQQWMNNFKNDGSGNNSNSNYSSHDAYIDNIHEQSTFKDSSTGENVSRDGQHDYNYTNNQGGYYGTDDPSFNPNSMPGDWQETEPLRPNY